MKVNKLIATCLTMCGESFDSKLLTYTNEQAEEDGTATKLLTCFNVAMCKVHDAFLRALCKAVVTAKDGKIDTTSLNLFTVLSLKDNAGNNVKYRYAQNSLLVDADGKYKLVYVKHYNSVKWTDDVIYPTPQVGQQLVVYAFATEYYRQACKPDKQALWQQRFTDSVKTLKKLSNMQMPARRWL